MLNILMSVNYVHMRVLVCFLCLCAADRTFKMAGSIKKQNVYRLLPLFCFGEYFYEWCGLHIICMAWLVACKNYPRCICTKHFWMSRICLFFSQNNFLGILFVILKWTFDVDFDAMFFFKHNIFFTNHLKFDTQIADHNTILK